jgi:hypothetical protein
MRNTIILLAAAATLAACATPPGFRTTPGVREISAAEATRCSFVANISARPGAYGPLAQQGLEVARNTITADALAAGANAVVFQPVSPGSLVTEVGAAAYRCPF